MQKENIDLKFKIVITNGDLNIKTPFGIKFSDIQQIMIEHTDNLIKRLSIYPNGLVIYFEQTASKITIRTNWPIEKDRFGELVIIEPK